MAAPGVLYLKFTNSRMKQWQAGSGLGKSYTRFSEHSKEADSNLWRAWVSRTQDFRGPLLGTSDQVGASEIYLKITVPR